MIVLEKYLVTLTGDMIMGNNLDTLAIFSGVQKMQYWVRWIDRIKVKGLGIKLICKM